MKTSELETMRKSFNTVKKRSNLIKDSPSTKRLIKRVQEIKKESIENNDYYLNQLLESFKRNDIDMRMAETAEDALRIIDGLINEYDTKAIAKAKSNTLGEINLKIILRKLPSMLLKRIWGTGFYSLKKQTINLFIQQDLLHI